MSASTQLVQWLIHAAIGSSILFGLTACALMWISQPAHRLRLIQLAMVAALVAPFSGCLATGVGWTVSLLPGEQLAVAPNINTSQGTAASSDGTVGSQDVTDGDHEGQIPAEDSAAAPRSSGSGGGFHASHVRDGAWWSGFAVRLYFAVAAALTLRLIFAAWMLRAIRRRCEVVPKWVSELLATIGGDKVGRTQVMISAAVDSPVAFGWRRPLIVIPSKLLMKTTGQEMRCVIAHEWSHIVRRDLVGLYLAATVQIVLWFQPLTWWLSRRLRLDQDYLADAAAIQTGSKAEDYAALLLALVRTTQVTTIRGALGIGDRPSQLARRIRVLFAVRGSFEPKCRRQFSCSATACVLMVLLAVSSLRPAAAGGDAPDKSDVPAPSEGESQSNEKRSPVETPPGTLTYNARVIDAITGAPLEGAEVTVRRERHVGTENTVLDETHHVTDAEGKYTITIPPKQFNEPFLYIELDVTHPTHAARKGFGYSMGMIRRNEKLGERPFFETTKLFPGEAITGRVETPDGKPAVGVKVLAFSRVDMVGLGSDVHSFLDTVTDEQGKFQLNVHTPGRVVFWLLPKQYALSAHRVDKRGDQGAFRLEPGVVLKGKVTDTEGAPLGNIWVSAEHSDRNSEFAKAISQMSVANHIRRASLTDANGNFELYPLPAGDYRVIPTERGWEPSEKPNGQLKPLSAVFAATQVTLQPTDTSCFIELRAVPHVTIEVQFLDSKGKPRRGHDFVLFGKLSGEFYVEHGHPDLRGHAILRAPRGLEEATIDLITNEHSVLRHRMSKDEPWKNQRRVELQSLTADVRTLEVTRYEAPIVLINALDSDGKQISNFQVTGKLPPGRQQTSGEYILDGKLLSDVNFEKQDDGRWRSRQMFPDEELTLSIQAAGYEPIEEKVTMPEGATREVNVVLRKKALSD